jgi:hypothetical protein
MLLQGRKQLPANRFYLFSVVIAACVFSACSGRTEHAGPQFKGRLLLLTKDRNSNGDLIEITPGSDSTYNHTVLTDGVFDAVASADQTRLLYTTSDGVFVRDLRSGTARQLAPGAGGGNICLAWSPDGNRFTFQARESQEKSARTKLYVSDLNGKTKLIWESYLGGTSSECGYWIAPDRLVFDRLVGVSTQNEKAGEVLLPNTTTIAIVGDQVKLVDTEKKWSIDGVCQSGSAAVVRPQYKEQPVLMAKNLDDLKTLNPSPVSCSSCRFVGFAARSCIPFFVEVDGKTSEVFSLNPINWQRQRAGRVDQPFSVTAQMLVSSSARLMIVGEGDSLLLVDADSGDVTSFFPKSRDLIWGKKIIGIQPLVWFEN